MPLFKPCPSCNLSEFKSRSARDSHVYRCKKKKPTSSEPTIQQSVSSPINEEDIIDRFMRGEIGEQDAVNEFERQWILANPRPQIGYREWSEKRALEIDSFRERLIKAKPSSPISQPISQPQRRLSLNEIAEMRAKELRGEVFTPTTPTQQPEPTQPTPVSKPSLPQQSPIFDLGKAIKSAIARFQKPKAPQEEPRQYYESPYGYSILTNPYLCDICKLRFSFQGQHEHFLQTGHKCRYAP